MTAEGDIGQKEDDVLAAPAGQDEGEGKRRQDDQMGATAGSGTIKLTRGPDSLQDTQSSGASQGRIEVTRKRKAEDFRTNALRYNNAVSFAAFTCERSENAQKVYDTLTGYLERKDFAIQWSESLPRHVWAHYVVVADKREEAPEGPPL